MIKKGLLTKHGKPNESTPQDWIKQEKLVFLIIPILFLSVLHIYLYKVRTKINFTYSIPVNPPPFRGSLPRKSLFSRMDWVSCTGDINLPHTPFPPAQSPPNKKIKYNKILTYILRSIFLEIPHLELPH